MNESERQSQLPVITLPQTYTEQGWSFSTKGLIVKAINMIDKHKVCTIILHQNATEDLQGTYNRVFKEIEKHYIENDKIWP